MKKFIAFAVVGFAALGAQAQDGSIYDQHSTQQGPVISSPTDHQNSYTCTTFSRHRSYRFTDVTLNGATNGVVRNCINSGGIRNECRQNVGCVQNEGNQTPGPTPPPTHNSYYDWGRGQNGFGYCYQFRANGQVMNYGQPVNNNYCERVRPSHYGWGYYYGNGWLYCFQWTPYMHAMNEGRPVASYLCQ